jgi:hypothetical protein
MMLSIVYMIILYEVQGLKEKPSSGTFQLPSLFLNQNVKSNGPDENHSVYRNLLKVFPSRHTADSHHCEIMSC